MTAQLKFPTPFGARNSSGLLCYGSKRSRSKHCATQLSFFDPKEMRAYHTLATDVEWMKYDSATIAILALALRQILETKGVVPFNRGSLVPRLVGSRLYLMEAYHGCIFPRYKWWLPYAYSEFSEALAIAIRYETLYPTTLVAERDKRSPSTELPPEPEMRTPVQMESTHREWLDELMALRAK